MPVNPFFLQLCKSPLTKIVHSVNSAVNPKTISIIHKHRLSGRITVDQIFHLIRFNKREILVNALKSGEHSERTVGSSIRIVERRKCDKQQFSLHRQDRTWITAQTRGTNPFDTSCCRDFRHGYHLIVGINKRIDEFNIKPSCLFSNIVETPRETLQLINGIPQIFGSHSMRLRIGKVCTATSAKKIVKKSHRINQLIMINNSIY